MTIVTLSSAAYLTCHFNYKLISFFPSPISYCFTANLAAEGLALCSLNLGRSPFSGWDTATGCYYNTSKPVYRPPWCSWSGVSCDSSSYSINSLDLYSPGQWLSGFSSKRTIPTSIAGLKGLTSISLNDMGYTGSIPMALCSLTNLNTLYLGWNSLSGTIPTAIANLKQLFDVNLDINRFNGTLPAALLNLPQLRYLSMQENFLSGLPSTINKNTVLNFLVLRNNRMIGTIPPGIGNLTNLVVLDLSNMYWNYTMQSWVHSFAPSAGLNGTLPAELYTLKSLEYLRLLGNRLSGTISPLISNMNNLQNIQLSGNSLNGAIPSSISSLNNLYQLTLDNNHFTGKVPKVFGNVPQDGTRYSLLLHNNYLTGAIPSMPYSYGPFVFTIDLNCQLTSAFPAVVLSSQTHCKPGTAGQLTPTAFPSPAPTPCM